MSFVRKVQIIVLLMIAAIGGIQAQATYLANEQFSTVLPQGWTVQPASTQTTPTWASVNSLSVSGSYSMHGNVPYNSGDTVELITPYYDCSNYKYVMLKFSHICKILQSDLCQVMYQEQGIGYYYKWQPIPRDAYKGSSVSYKNTMAFDHNSYPEWQGADTFATASNSWWKEETFDISDYASFTIVRFKFVIKKGSYFGSFIADGWYVDDFQVMASNYPIIPPVVKITSEFADTVYNTGPFAIEAKVAGRAGCPIVRPYLHYSATYNNVTKNDSILMESMDGGDSLWTATIPQHVFGTDITYYINGYDSVGNSARDAGGFFLKYLAGGGSVGYVVIGTSTVDIEEGLPFEHWYDYSWSRTLYLGSELSKTSSGGMITKIAFQQDYTGSSLVYNQLCYMKAVKDVNVNNFNYEDPTKNGSTLVWKGTYDPFSDVNGWVEITLNTPFILPPGSNLMVYWENYDGVYDDAPDWYCTYTKDVMGTFAYDDGAMPTGYTGDKCDYRPNTRFFMMPLGKPDTNSVAMYAIDNPQEGTIAGKQPVKVTIKNKGIGDLTSAKINWMVNGVLQTAVTWKGNLPCDFNDTITLGYYTQKLNGYDTIVCWVNTPNNVYDSTTMDDTLSVIAYGCSSYLNGVYTVGNGKSYDFQTIEEALFNLTHCGVSGNVELQMASGVYDTALNFTEFNSYMGRYQLTISSIAKDADSVIFRPKTGNVVTLGNTTHLIFKNLTFDANIAAGQVVNFQGGCEDVEFYHCHLMGLQTQSSSTTYAVLYSSSAFLNNVRFIGNRMDGGGYGLYIYGSSAQHNKMVFDSNYIESSYYYPLYFYYTDMNFSHNTLMEAPGHYNYFYTYFYYSYNSLFDGNHIQTNGYSSYQYPFRFYYTDSTTLVCNNEIVCENNNYTTYAMYIYSYGTKFINNSIYCHGTGSTHYGMYVYGGASSYSGVIKNNNVVIDPNTSGTTYPCYLSSNSYVSNWDIDYNNWYSKSYIGYVGTAISTLSNFQSAVPTAIHESNEYPLFADTTDLRLRNYMNLKCPAYPGVNHDKDGQTRFATTGRGCYTSAPDSVNAGLMTILNWPTVGTAVGDTLRPSVVLQNSGMTDITTATIGWKVNNVAQSPVQWSGLLKTGETDTVALGSFVCVAGYNDITAYLISIGTLKDDNPNDDTVSVSNYTCSSIMSGTYTIGDTGYFKSLDEAISVLERCGLGGPVTLAFAPGLYRMNTTISFIGGMSATNTLTITSIDKDSSKVILQRADDASANLAPIMINGGQYIEISHVSLIGESPTSSTYYYSHGIMITGNSEHINVHNCYIEVPKSFSNAVTGTSQNPVYLYGAGVRDVRFHHNLVEGGATAFYVYGSGTASRIAQITIDSNEIGYIDYASIYAYYSDSVTFNYNVTHQRRGNFTVGNMYNIYSYYTNMNVENNIFDLESIYYGYYYYYSGDSTKGFWRIANNELRSGYGASSSGYLTYFYETQCQMVHNSNYLNNTTANHYGFYLTSSYVGLDIRNNIFHMTSKSVNGYPIYISSTSYVANSILDYNCYYNEYPSSPRVGYAGSAITTIGAWKSAIPKDANSVFAKPHFANPSVDLHLLDTNGISCPSIASVPTDIRGLKRDSVLTVRGAYGMEFFSRDLAVVSIDSPTDAESIYDSVLVKVTITNIGWDTITSAKLAFELNGVASTTYNWSGRLATNESEAVTIGYLVPKVGINSLKAYCFNPNGSVDGNVENDTITKEFFGCDAALSGKYTVGGKGADFADMKEAIDVLTNCGVGGPVEMLIATGSYEGFSISGVFPGSSKINKVTFRSKANNRDSVIFEDMSAVKLEQTAHLFFEEISFIGDVIGVEMAGTITDVDFHHCDISAPIQNHTSYRAVSYNGVSGGTDRLDGVRFIGNNIVGGYYNMYMYYICGSTSDMTKGEGLTIDSNNLVNAIYYGLYAYYYGNYRSFSHNTVTNYTGISSTYYGVYSYYYKAWSRIEGNRLNINSTTTAYGFYNYYYQNYAGYTPYDTAYFINNEIIMRGSGTKYAAYIYYPYGNYVIANNSIFTNTTSLSYGLYLYNTTTAYVPIVYNNMLVNGNNSGYPMYIATNTYTTSSYFRRDYNNFYSGGSYLAYLGAAKSTLAAIKSTSTTVEQNSINVAPVWKSVNNSMEVSNSKSFSCPSYGSVNFDIVGAPRVGTTAMGCYGIEPDSNDASLASFAGLELLTSTASSPIKVVIWNVGRKAIDSANVTLLIDGVAQAKVSYMPKSPLAYLQRDTVDMGSFLLANGVHTFMAYVEMQNDTNGLNDTIVEKRKICSQTIAGTYIVGTSKSADYTFAQLSSGLFTEMVDCGVTGDVTIVFEKATYSGSIDLSPIADAMGEYHLTLTSETGNRNDVTISSSSTKILNIGAFNKNITVKNLTLWNTSTSSSTYVVYLDNGCSDIDILHNNLLRDTTSTTSSTYVIYNSSDGTIKNINIIGNLIRGGYYGTYLYGSGSSAVNENIVIDSNEIVSQYYYACYNYYNGGSICHNRILDRRSNGYSYWYGLYCYYGQIDSIVGNIIDATRYSHSYPYTMYTGYMNYYGNKGTALVANNTIRSKSTSGGYGVYSYMNTMNFFHNTIHIEGTGTSAYGVYFYGYSPYITNFMGNIFDVSSSQWAFYNSYTGTTAVGSIMDYNDYYNHGGSNLVYIYSSGHSTLASLQAATGMDAHSCSMAPSYKNLSKDLSINGAYALAMPRMSEVMTDIEGTPRNAMTYMGAYESDFGKLDAVLVDFANTKLSTTGSPVYVTLLNFGMDTLKSATINWTVNGVTQTPVNWTGKLAPTASDVVTLGNATAVALAKNSLVAWVTNPNNGTDVDHKNDTAKYEEYFCNGKFAAGTYTVGGSNPDFADPDAMMMALKTCGIAGPVVMKIRPGTYKPLNFTGNINGSSSTNTITFMPDNGKVVFDGGSAGPGLVLNGTSNMTFTGMTFGNTSNGLIGVQMKNGCSNVTIRECNIYASVTTTSSSYRAFDYPNSSGSAYYPVNVKLIRNNISGGYYNMYLYYLAGSSSYMTASSMYIDSNVLTEGYYYGIYAYYYAGIPSLSYNTIKSRDNSSGYYGLYSYYYKNYGQIVGNKLNINCSSTGYGLYLYYYQNYPSYSTGSMLVANNEIRIMGNGIKYGMYLYTYYSDMEIHHNSVFSNSETSTAYGAYLYAGTSSSYKTNFTRNLLYVDGMTNYPLYLANTTASYNGPAYGLREWNNLYSSDNVAYAGSARQSVADLQAYTTQDSNTLNLRPSFVKLRNGLELNDYDPFMCPSISYVTNDLNGNPRAATTAIGCYGAKMWDGINLVMEGFVTPVAIADVICYADSTPVEISFKNMGRSTAYFDSTSVKVDLDVTGAISMHYDTVISVGSLSPTQSMKLRLTTIPTMASGIYKIKVKLTHKEDVESEDDTMSLAYNASRVELPYDVNFSSTPNEFVNVTLSGDVEWQVAKGTGSTPAVSPDFGTGRLEFAGAGKPGAFANAIFNAVNIRNCINPRLRFWYAHSADNTRRDLTVVLVTTDGGANFTEVGRIMQADTFTGWKEYVVDLNRFANEPCLSLVFQAISYGGANQSIDRILITADQDASLTLLPVDFSSLTACENSQVPLRVVVSNQSSLNMTMDSDTITASLSGASTQNFSYVYSKLLSGHESDTITLGNMDLRSNGNYYLNIAMQSQDDNTLNDTIADSTLYIYQDIVLDSLIGIDNKVSLLGGDTVWVSVQVRNGSNLPVDRFTVTMELDGEMVVTDTVMGRLEIGDSTVHAMSAPYIVPLGSKEQPFYFLEVKAGIACDADATNNELNVVGNINVPDTIDLQVLAIAQPATDSGRVKVSPKVTIANMANTEVYTVMMRVDVMDSADRVLETVSEYINFININDTIEYEFSLTYTVPNYNGSYSLRAYVDTYDGETNTANDTLTARFNCKFNDVAVPDFNGSDWSMGQNIPNPARTETKVPYNVPEDGEVVFSVLSATGQVIYQQRVAATAGEGELSVNTSDWAAGLYYYSMEYKGQRLVRKMNVVK